MPEESEETQKYAIPLTNPPPTGAEFMPYYQEDKVTPSLLM